jgi:hypothetical protein
VKRQFTVIKNFDDNISSNSSATNQKGYIIGSRTVTNNISFATAPKVHDSETSAKREAERLAKANPGKKFVVVQIVGEVVSGGVSWS